MPGIKVAIIGAGPAGKSKHSILRHILLTCLCTGCLLARLLHRDGINVTVFEGESSPNFRSQGGTLDLHTATGLAALREADLFDEFLKHARYDGQYMAVVDKKLGYHMVRGATGSYNKIEERPEIDRSSLRELLTNSLPEGTIKWGYHLKYIEGESLIFSHTTETGFDLVIGADGAWSKVRKFLDPDLVPLFSGVGGHDLEIVDGEETAPELYQLVNRGSLFASSDGHRFTVQQMGDGSLSIYATHVTEAADWYEKCDYDAHNLEETKKYLLEKQYQDWCPELREAIEKADGKCNPRSLFYLPVGARWPHKPGFTLIGDAAHLMTPYAGEGVNQALDDARLLAHAISTAEKEKKKLDPLLEEFEDAMFARVTEVQQLTYDLCQDWFFTPGAPKACMAKAMSRHVKHKMPWALQPLGVAMVHSYYFFKYIMG